MTVLIIDTTTERGLVALGNFDGTIVAEKRLPAGFQNSDHLFPTIQELEIKPETLVLIICAVGPGSFTGIRVGAVVAKTLSFVNKVPLVGVCTLEGFAAPALIDAKMGGAYVLQNGQWERMPLELALEVVGAGVVHTPNASLLKIKAPSVQWEECYPSAERYLAIGLAKAAEGSTDGDLEILY